MRGRVGVRLRVGFYRFSVYHIVIISGVLASDPYEIMANRI